MHLNETLFYVFGIGAAVSAVLFTFVGLKVKGFPGKAAPLVVIWFVVFVGGAATFSVLHAQDVEAEHAHEDSHASEIYEEDAEDKEAGASPTEDDEEEEEGAFDASEGEKNPETGESESQQEAERELKKGEAKKEASTGSATTLQLAADPAALAYDTTELTAKAGEVTIDFDNPAPLGHDVAVFEDGKEIAATEVITEAEDTLSANLKAGEYTFLCTVPGHAEAGMEGTLKVE